MHDPGKVLLDATLAIALGSACLADVGMPRAEPGVFGPVASDPTVSRLIDTLAASGEKALTAIRAARSEVRKRVWELAGEQAPDAGGQVIVDLDGVLAVAHSDKQDAAPTWKKTYGHHPLMGFVDHGPEGPENPSRLSCAQATRARTRPPTTSPPPASPSLNYQGSTGEGSGRWSAATPVAAPMSSWPGSPSADAGCPTQSAW
ncbi:hypothetical protein H4687_007723 [Streptomyces stelliscabiei]|uniref:Transposase DDE domain-containing protein n=1 Tax=Streptomyces stelliscabiei TaxID=146820 RepID=A0A8I0TVA6_9ACTN|nr:hypothetical protein [Streptomyces stelliscabiei]